jgi:hypothetical protein
MQLLARAVRQRAGLRELVEENRGTLSFRIALIDGLIDTGHPCLSGARIQQHPRPSFVAGERGRLHATFIASTLLAVGDELTGLCPGCSLISIPIVSRDFEQGLCSPKDAARQLAAAIREAISQNADIIQLSISFNPEHSKYFGDLHAALARAAAKSIHTVIAAGNDGALGSSALLSAPGVIPVAMAGEDGLPHGQSTLSATLGSRGLRAPGMNIPGAGPGIGYRTATGSSYAASVVTASFALLAGAFPHLRRETIAAALLRFGIASVRSIVPPLLNADAAYRALRNQERRTASCQHR